MRIKFLSLIASFFIVSFVVTSCLNDNTIEYSPDATIHAFELDTVYGVKYKFTIDQIRGEIYNIDSMPVHADTIIDKILITSLNTASGIVTMKSHDGTQDSIINLSDSINFSNTMKEPLKITVWAPDLQIKKDYRISVRVHQHDPDSLRWQYTGNITNGSITGEQKSIILNNQVLTYSVIGNSLNVYKTALSNGINWQGSQVNGLTQLPTSILNFKEILYATSGDGNVYTSNDGISWTTTSLFGNNVDLLLAPFGEKITYTVNTTDGKREFYTAAGGVNKFTGNVPADFPIKNISYTFYQTVTGQNAILLVGQPKERTTIGDGSNKVETTVPWGYEGNEWVSFPPNNTGSYCPAFNNPSIIYYDNQYYIFGDGFTTIYTSQNVIAWKKANKKFSFPYITDWTKEGITLPNLDPLKFPEFRDRKIYSMILDPATQYIWIMFSAGSATVTETVEKEEEEDKTKNLKATEEVKYTYSYKDEVWKGRLNQLWFDLTKR